MSATENIRVDLTKSRQYIMHAAQWFILSESLLQATYQYCYSLSKIEIEVLLEYINK